MQKEPTIEFFLSNFIELFLGDQEFVEIPEELANEIKSKEGWERFCSLQFEAAADWRNSDWTIKKLKHPRLWNKKAFANDNDKMQLAKFYAHKQVVQYNLFEANVRIVQRVIAQELGVEGDGARVIAHKLLRGKKQQQLNALGITKLLTKEEEL